MYREEGFAPGRQDLLKANNPVFRSAALTVAPLTFSVECLRPVDCEITSGVWPDMTEHGWDKDDWPRISQQVMAAEILVIGTSIWLGEKTSVCTEIVERLYATSHLLNQHGQYA